MNDPRLVRLHMASGAVLTAVFEGEGLEDEDIETDILHQLHQNPREFVNLGGIIVHTGAVSAVELT